MYDHIDIGNHDMISYYTVAVRQYLFDYISALIWHPKLAWISGCELLLLFCAWRDMARPFDIKIIQGIRCRLFLYWSYYYENSSDS